MNISQLPVLIPTWTMRVVSDSGCGSDVQKVSAVISPAWPVKKENIKSMQRNLHVKV